MSNLFKKAIMFTDLHVGHHNNERQFNIDCLNFVKWAVEEAKKENADAIMFLGDWHHNRQSIHLMTLHYSIKCFEELNNSGIKTYFIPGNHDEMYKDKRDVDSVVIGNNYENIEMINDPVIMGNCAFFPWLVQDEYKEVRKTIKKVNYIFGHFELPTFMMNAMVEMPDHGNLKLSDFDNLDGYAFTGHFHKRQRKGNVWYIGNCFPHNFSDTWDDERGIAILEWGKEPEFKKWPDAPSYKTMSLSDLLENHDMITDNSYVKISNDIGLLNEELVIIKSIFNNQYKPRKIELTNTNNVDVEDVKIVDSNIMSIDEIVIQGLKEIDSNIIDKDTLIELYKDLEV